MGAKFNGTPHSLSLIGRTPLPKSCERFIDIAILTLHTCDKLQIALLSNGTEGRQHVYPNLLIRAQSSIWVATQLLRRCISLSHTVRSARLRRAD